MGWKLTVTVALFTFSGTVLLVRHVAAPGRAVPDLSPPPASTTTVLIDPTAPTPPTASRRMPGVHAGEAALAPLTLAEVARRCQLRWDLTWGRGRPMPPIRGLLPSSGPPDPTFNAGESVIVAARPVTIETIAEVPVNEQFECSIPGDLVPGRADLATLKDNRIATEPQALLKRCSTVLWHDISGWTVVSSSAAAKTAAAFVAVSPSGKYVAECRVSGEEMAGSFAPRDVGRILPAEPAPQFLRDRQRSGNVTFFSEAVDTCTNPRLPCIGQLYVEIHRLPLPVTKVRLESIHGGPDYSVDGTTELPVAGPNTWLSVKDGWLAVAWADGSRKPCAHGRLTAYDGTGRVVGFVSDPPPPPEFCRPTR